MRFMMIGEERGHKHAQGQKGKERHEMGYEGDVMSTSTGEMVEAVMETVENPPLFCRCAVQNAAGGPARA